MNKTKPYENNYPRSASNATTTHSYLIFPYHWKNKTIIVVCMLPNEINSSRCTNSNRRTSLKFFFERSFRYLKNVSGRHCKSNEFVLSLSAVMWASKVSVHVGVTRRTKLIIYDIYKNRIAWIITIQGWDLLKLQ